MLSKRSVSSLLALLVASGCTADAAPLPRVELAEAVASITPEDLSHRIFTLAHDSMRGRDTPSPELDAAAEWVAAEFERMGLRPGMNGEGYIQHFAIERVAPDLEASGIVVTGSEQEILFGRDVAFPGGAVPAGDLDGPIVVIDGARLPSAGLPDGAVEGAHVVLVAGEQLSGPAGLALRRVIEPIAAGGPRSILLTTDRALADFEEQQASLFEVGMTRLPWRDASASSLPLFAIRHDVAAALVGDAGVALGQVQGALERNARITPVDGISLTLSPRVRVLSEALAPNVVGVVEGGDPALKDEYIVFSAHLDHVGVGRPDSDGDSIYNGADDNASGTATIMEIAEAFAMLDPAPRRSIMVVAVSGEEKGLWGSEYFAGNPPVPVDELVANINMDMVGRNWPDTIVAIGKEHSDLGSTLDRVNARHPELGMTAIDDIWPEQNFYFRSDHYNFARKGVPVLFFFNGVHIDYHRPGDEPEKIDFEKTARIGRLAFLFGVEIANADQKPQWTEESYQRIVVEGLTR